MSYLNRYIFFLLRIERLFNQNYVEKDFDLKYNKRNFDLFNWFYNYGYYLLNFDYESVKLK